MDWIEFLKYILLGIVQGACEILPISSSGHLVLAYALLGFEEVNLAFSVFLHFASLIAALIFLRKQVWRILKGSALYLFKKDQEQKNNFHYLLLLIISTAVTAVIGLIFKDQMAKLSSVAFVGIALIINGFWILIFDHLKGERRIDDLPLWKALIIGLGQGVGVLPGISRSGATIGTSICVGLKKEDAAEYAFLLFLPITLGATILEVQDLMTVDKSLIPAYAAGFVLAFLTTYLALVFFLKIIRKRRLLPFAIYCFIVGLTATLVAFL